jgi:hypothetical protein
MVTSVNVSMMLEVALDLQNFYFQYPALRRIWAYLMCAKEYKIDTIVIGQSPYNSNIVSTLGAAFSQKEATPDTPTTDVFSRHFEDIEAAKDFIRSTWKLLPMGKLFVNADYLPSNMGGGNSDIECVKRVNRTVELLLSIVLSQDKPANRVKIVCVGNIAMSCGSLLSRRLRALGFSVDQTTCRQPLALARVEFNNHLIGKDDKYLFCGPKVLAIFQNMINEHKSRPLAVTKESDIIDHFISNMSTQRLSPMTKVGLEEISAEMKAVCERLSVKRKEIHNNKDVEDIIDSLCGQVMEISKSVGNLTNILLGDAYTYKVITEGQSSQLAVASREQHMSVGLDQGFEVESRGMSSVGRSAASTPAFERRRAAKSMFKSKVASTPVKSDNHPPSVVSALVSSQAPAGEEEAKTSSTAAAAVGAAAAVDSVTPNRAIVKSLKKSSGSKATGMFKPVVKSPGGDSKSPYKTTSEATSDKVNPDARVNRRLAREFHPDVFGSSTTKEVGKEGGKKAEE